MAEIMKQYEIFLLKAKEDFNAAKYLLDGYWHHNLEIRLDVVFFHLQQCAEKLLKTLLDFYNVKFPKTHDIEDLIGLCMSNNIILDKDIDILVDLTDYAVEGRYAVIHDDLQDASKYVLVLEELLLVVKNTIMEQSNG